MPRRRFLKQLGAAVAGLAFGSGASRLAAASPATGSGAPTVPPRGLVLEIHKPGSIRQGTPDRRAVVEMMERGMLELTGTPDLGSAWKCFVAPEDVVGIKVDCRGSARGATSKEVVREIIRGVKSAGVADNQIIVFDRFGDKLHAAGYRHNARQEGVRCFATEGWLTPAGYSKEVFYGGGPPGDSTGSFLSTIVGEMVTKVINVPILSDDSSSGISGALKNVAFGVINNTDRFALAAGDPAIADIWTRPEVGEKVVLNVLDALRIQFDRGPSWDPEACWDYSSLLFSTDPVALDTVGLWLIENKRVAEELPAITGSNRPADHIATAAKRGLGVGDWTKIKLVTVDLPRAKK